MPRFDRVDFAYPDQRPILADFSLTLPDRGAVCLLGPSGCGKTTVLRLLAGLGSPQGGRILGMGRRRVAVVFQEDRLLPWETAWENAISQVGTAQREWARDWLTRLGLADQLDELPGELSGGMKRRVAIARALVARPDVLLLDEPFSGLDEPSWRRAAELIVSDSGAGLTLLVTHVPDHADALGASVIRLDGPPVRVLA